MEDLTKEEIWHLQFIYDRLHHVYHEPENIDFMLSFKAIIDKLK